MKKLKQIQVLIVDIFDYIARKYFVKTKLSDKVVFVEMNNPNLYHRYFYNLLKTLQIGGYQIVYPMNFSKFRNLKNGDIYLALILKENREIIIKNLPRNKNFITLKDEQFSADYYKTYFEDDNIEQNSFHIPMSFHPYMYLNNLWEQPINNGLEKINAVFCFGNFDRVVYREIHKSPFEIINRADLIENLSKQDHFISLKSRAELDNIIQRKEQKKLIFVEKYNFQIPISEVRKVLSQFRFFLCCPGVFAPLSHNFVEAVSTGAIPIIQDSYAKILYPNLEHLKNAIIFKDLQDLHAMIDEKIFNLSDLVHDKKYN